MVDIPIRDEWIELDKLLKLAGVAQTGGHAKILIQGGEVKLNGEVETRRRKKVSLGEYVTVEGMEEIIEVVSQ